MTQYTIGPDGDQITVSEADWEGWGWARGPKRLWSVLGKWLAQASADSAVVARQSAATIKAQVEALVGQVTIGSTQALAFPGVDKVLATAADVVAVHVYDTRLDSDGGAWRLRCQRTSWYAEALNSATRGVRREFPMVALIVARSGALTIYDAMDLDPVTGVPRVWKVFTNASASWATANALCGTNSGVNAKEGQIWLGDSSGGFGLVRLDFPADKAFRRVSSGGYGGNYRGGLGKANSGLGYAMDLTAAQAIVNSTVNAVHARVLPGAPLDPVSGLPVPTVVVATASGASVIHPSGAVHDVTGFAISACGLTERNALWLIPTSAGAINVGAVPYGDVALSSWRSHFHAQGGAGGALSLVSTGLLMVPGVAHAGASGLTFFAEDPGNPANGMVAFATYQWATPWQVGNVRLCLSGGSLTDRSSVGTVVTGTATFAAVAGGDLQATTATSALTAPVTTGGVAYGWLFTGGAWKHCKTMADWGGAVTESGGTLTIASGTVFTRLVYTTTTPSPAQSTKMEADDRALFASGARMLLGGASNNVQSLSRDDLRDLLHVATAAGVSAFHGLARVSYLDAAALVALTTDSMRAVSASGGIVLYGSAAEAGVTCEAVVGKEAVLDRMRPRDAGGAFRALGVTADATPVDLSPRVLIGEREEVMIEARILGRVYGATDSETISYARKATYLRNASGNVTLKGSVQAIGTDTETTGTADATFQIDTASQTVSVRVTGVAATRIVWTASLTVTRYSEESAYA